MNWSDRQNMWAAQFVVTLAVVLLLSIWIQNRGLFIDEANLARNILDKGFWEFFAHLDYQQYCPPIFMILVKGVTSFLGNGEMSMRLVSLFAAFGVIWGMYMLINRNLSKIALIPALLLVAFSPYFLRYGTELKQYSFDAFITVGTLLLIHHYPPSRWNRSTAISAGFIGGIAIWASMPLIFLLAGLSLSLVLNLHWKRIKPLLVILPSAIWIMSFAVYYSTILSQELSAPNLKAFHQTHFLFFPKSFSELKQFVEVLLSIPRTAFGSTTIEIGYGILFSIVGIFVLARRDKNLAITGGAAILACLAASSFQWYSLKPRLILFMMPIIVLFFAAGWNMMMTRKMDWKWKAALALPLFVIIINWSPWIFVTEEYRTEEVREATIYACQQNAPKIVHPLAVPAFDYYTRLNPLATCSDSQVYFSENEDDLVRKMLTPGKDSLLLVFGQELSKANEFISKTNGAVILNNQRIWKEAGVVWCVKPEL